ncbi:MAG: hypothetical protein QF561_07755 [Phycisphaerales bacterium]|jgi:hypothetical protein|nr:hypothetical protein [Phycisphaerales bacterium]
MVTTWTLTACATVIGASFANLAAAAPQDPNHTATIYVHGFDPDGASMSGVFGEDTTDPLLGVLGEMAGLPLIANNPAANAIAATTYYGDTPPEYYTAVDIAELDAITAEYGGGMPRYALIVAKYARHVMDRTGAAQVNIVSASMGTYVSRWLIEHDSDELASDGLIARWLSLEGVLAGHWGATDETVQDLWDDFGTPTVDVDQMHYDWCQAHYGDRHTMDNPIFADMLVGMEISSRDTEGDLTDVMLLVGDYHANDGVVTTDDAWFHSVEPQATFHGHDPTQSWFHVNHYELAEHPPGMAQVVNFITGRRRARVILQTAQITDLHEPDDWFWDWTPAEIVFTSSAVSPAAETLWGITQAMCDRPAESYAAPIHEVSAEGDTIAPAHILFDDFLTPGETSLIVTIGAIEVDGDVKYGVDEFLLDSGWESLGEATVSVDVSSAGVTSQPVSAADFNGTLRVEVIEYPFPELEGSTPGDIDGDGVVGVEDLLAIIAAWGPCDACDEDLNDDGLVDVSDILALLSLWTA